MASAAVEATASAERSSDGVASSSGDGCEGGGAAAAAAETAPPIAWPVRSDCRYAASYCEENVYWLAQSLQGRASATAFDFYVVFISNASKSVPLWRQRAAASPEAPTVWDYHVICVAQADRGPALVLDLDSTLPFPCPLADYRRQALLGTEASLPPRYHRQYRVVPAPLFLRHFASDRTHMVGQGGAYLQPPPPWSCIVAADGATNSLPRYLDFLAAAAAREEEGKEEGTCAAEEAAEQERDQPQRQQQQQQQGRDGSGGTATPALHVSRRPCTPWLGALLDEPAFLRRFGLH